MSLPNYRATEALYIVFVQDKNAEQLLKHWAKSVNAQVTIESNRMKIFDQRSYNLFLVEWSHDWDNVTIWDTWNKRHIHSN
jgi:hypothetical protein